MQSPSLMNIRNKSEWSLSSNLGQALLKAIYIQLLLKRILQDRYYYYSHLIDEEVGTIQF